MLKHTLTRLLNGTLHSMDIHMQEYECHMHDKRHARMQRRVMRELQAHALCPLKV